MNGSLALLSLLSFFLSGPSSNREREYRSVARICERAVYSKPALWGVEQAVKILPPEFGIVVCDLLRHDWDLWERAVFGLLSHEKESVVNLLTGQFEEMPEWRRAFIYDRFGWLGWPELRSFAETDIGSTVFINHINAPAHNTLGMHAREYLYRLDHPNWYSDLQELIRAAEE
jgi:hypothetical protein